MIRVMQTSFYANKGDVDRLFACNRVSGQVWNATLDSAKQYGQATGRWIGKSELQKAVKGRFPIHSQSIQAVCHKYLWARDGAKQAIEQGCQARYPWRQKKYFPTKWAKDGFRLHESGRIELSLGIWNGKRQRPIVVQVKRLPVGQIKEIELIWKRKLMLAFSCDDGVVAKENNGHSVAAIDLGEIHTIAAVSEAGPGIIITGRKLRSIKRLRNKQHRELQKKMAKVNKGSRRWKKLQRAKRKISVQAQAQTKDLLHKTSHTFVNWAAAHEVKTVVVGEVEGVERHTSAKNKNATRRRSRNVNQKISQWSFGQLVAYLAYKLAAWGIGLVKTDETYTTRTCPVCGRQKKVAGRVYRCHCGYAQHRDIHGARNILAKYQYGKIQDLPNPVAKVTYLRPTAKWQVVVALNRACRRAGAASSRELQLSGVPKIAPKPFAG